MVPISPTRRVASIKRTLPEERQGSRRRGEPRMQICWVWIWGYRCGGMWSRLDDQDTRLRRLGILWRGRWVYSSSFSIRKLRQESCHGSGSCQLLSKRWMTRQTRTISICSWLLSRMRLAGSSCRRERWIGGRGGFGVGSMKIARSFGCRCYSRRRERKDIVECLVLLLRRRGGSLWLLEWVLLANLL